MCTASGADDVDESLLKLKGERVDWVVIGIRMNLRARAARLA